MNKETIRRISLKQESTSINRVQINSSASGVQFLIQSIAPQFENIGLVESFFVIMMDRSNTTIGFSEISKGGVAGTVVDIKIIAKLAVESLASSIMLVHNHPSGNTNYSTQDKLITDKIKKAMNLFDIELLDHIILGGEGESYYSFADNGLV